MVSIPRRFSSSSAPLLARNMTYCTATLALFTLTISAAFPAFAIDCLQPRIAAEYQPLIRPVPPEQMRPAARQAMTPPEDPDVGDSWIWYTWKLAGFPVPEEKMCTVRGEGKNVYIVVDDSQWLTNVFQEDVDRMIEAWDNSSLGSFPEQGIYELDTTNFGPAPDELDEDPKIYVLYYDFDVSSDGFFWPFDQYPDGTQQFASNECEVLYMNSSVFDPGGDYLISVQAHEFQHMIHWLADDNESPWVNEGCGELAMWLYGHPDQVTSFPTNPDNNLTAWNGSFADYVKTYLWMLYFYEHFGGQAAILDLVADPANGILGFDQTLADRGYTERFADIVPDWFVANYLDDPTIGGGKYHYAGEDLPPFNAIVRSSYPIPPTPATVNHWAADYVRMIDGTPQRLFFDGGDNSTWSARVIRFFEGTPISVEEIPLDDVDAGYLDLLDFGDEADEVVLVCGNISTAGVTTYSYRSEAAPSSAGEVAGESLALRLRSVGANPFDGTASLLLETESDADAEVVVIDIQGRRVCTLHQGSIVAGAHPLSWDGNTDGGHPAPPGTYFVRARTSDGVSAAHRIVVLQ